jgi:hypothetical protein
MYSLRINGPHAPNEELKSGLVSGFLFKGRRVYFRKKIDMPPMVFFGKSEREGIQERSFSGRGEIMILKTEVVAAVIRNL